MARPRAAIPSLTHRTHLLPNWRRTPAPNTVMQQHSAEGDGMKRIVVGVDFSAASPDVARWACRFVPSDGSALLTHIIPAGAVPNFLRGMKTLIGAQRERGEAEARSRLEELGRTLPCQAELRVSRGRAAEGIARVGADIGAELLAIGPRGARASRLGTTAEQLVREADRPVLVVHDPKDADPGALLLAVDASAHSADVLRWGRRLMDHFGARATVLHVLEGELLVALRVADEGSAERKESERAIAAARDWIAEQVTREGLAEGETTIEAVFGSPVHEIARRTEANGHDLVIMGSRGLGGVRREIFGSVASGVLRAAWGPVLVV